jgi:hypothetical protein
MPAQNKMGCLGFLLSVITIVLVMRFIGNLMRDPKQSREGADSRQDDYSGVQQRQHADFSKLALAQTTITKFSWHNGGFDSVMLATFSIKNDSDYDVKDLELKCIHSAPSGTVIDQNEQTVYQIVKAHSTRILRDVNMGFIASQVSSSSCEIVNLALSEH